MEVIRKNFKETLPVISASIKKADFLVIDAEFTGLINGREVSIFDTPEEYYNCLLHGSTEFLLIQYGLCAFYWDPKEKHYMNDAFNFYVFPRGRPGPEKMFLCQSSSLDFLSSQGFDFNKWVRDGISYMTEPAETRVRENLIERQKSYGKAKDNLTIPEEHKQLIQDVCKKVRQFLDDNKSNEMDIDRCNSFVRMLLYQELRTRFKDEVIVETKILENKDRVLKVRRITCEDDAKNHTTSVKEREWAEVEEAVGFSKVARMISESEKLVIGHNMLLDILHTLNHFFQPLPSDYASFKEFAHCMFPSLLDTKYMSSLPPFKDKVTSSVLQHLLCTLSEAPFTIPKVGSEEGRGYSLSNEKHHEAGYDAFVTGLCFLAMHAHLTRMRGEDDCRLVSPQSAILKPFLNKIFLARTAHQDSPYMNLSGADPKPCRDHVFHLTFPKEWQRNDLNQLFSPFGAITLQFLDDTSAIVALSRRDQARAMAKILARNGRVALVPYAKYKNLNSKVVTRGSQQRAVDAKTTASPDTRPRQVVPSNVSATPAKVQELPEKVHRTRLNSTTEAEKPTPPARKRTSSGVFEIDEAEPPLKKPEAVRSPSEGSPNPKAVTNGRRKTAATPESDKDKYIQQKKKVIDTFDSTAKTNCVSAFKESDNWD